MRFNLPYSFHSIINYSTDDRQVCLEALEMNIILLFHELTTISSILNGKIHLEWIFIIENYSDINVHNDKSRSLDPLNPSGFFQILN